MKVYVITEGSYSDYHIEAVRLSIDDALEIAFRVGGNVEEYDTDEKEGRWAEIDEYQVRLNVKTGREIFVIRSLFWHEEKKLELVGEDFVIDVYARNKDHALKIARDKLAEMKAEQLL